MPSYIPFCARRDPATFMSQAENQVRSSGLRMEPAVSKPFIETIDERDLLNLTAPLRFSPSVLFSGGGNAQRSLIRSEKLDDSYLHDAWYTIYCQISSHPPSLLSAFLFFSAPIF